MKEKCIESVLKYTEMLVVDELCGVEMGIEMEMNDSWKLWRMEMNKILMNCVARY